MAGSISQHSYLHALQDFRNARRKAGVQAVIARLTGKSDALLSYEDVRQKLRAQESARRELRDIPLDAIIGSVGRYVDFTRNFLPKYDSDEGRWAAVGAGMLDIGLPPIEVYQIGEAYFVLDGNHRVSVARQMDSPTIQAYVTEVRTKVSLTPDVQPDELIIKARYIDFLERTKLDKICPDANPTVTAPGQYRLIEADIEAHRFLLERSRNEEMSYEEAVLAWCNDVYLPVVEVIRERGLLRDFPARTATDLYVWLVEHRVALRASLGWEVTTEAAADHLAAEHSTEPGRIIARVGEKLKDAVTPDALESGPPTGQWRRGQVATRRNTQLFISLLVPVSGTDGSWYALDQAITIAHRSGSTLNGLHMVASEDQKDSEQALAVKAEFERRCAEATVSGKLVIEAGNTARKITARAKLVDMVVTHLAHPPQNWVLSRLESNFRKLLRRSPRPVLAVPGPAAPLNNALLAYDGGAKAQEALFIATYLAGYWGIPLTVVSVEHGDADPDNYLAGARDYLRSRGVEAAYVKARGPVPDAILNTAGEHHSDLILMGGYTAKPMVEVVLGSVVDEMLRRSKLPILICR